MNELQCVSKKKRNRNQQTSLQDTCIEFNDLILTHRFFEIGFGGKHYDEEKDHIVFIFFVEISACKQMDESKQDANCRQLIGGTVRIETVNSITTGMITKIQIARNANLN